MVSRRPVRTARLRKEEIIYDAQPG